jgi:hypothetical protein
MSPAIMEQSPSLAAALETPQDLYRILLLRQNGSEVLVAGTRPPFTLPCVEVPRWERAAENMNAIVRKRYGICPVCLFSPDLPAPATDSEPTLYQVMGTRKTNLAAPQGTHWLPVDAFSDRSLADADFRALTNTLRQMHEFENETTTGPFGKPCWIEELFSWAQHEVDAYGLRLNGEFRQLNASPTFALLRLESNGPAVWFKAVGEPNLREFPISVTLSRLFPRFVPTVIATHPAWNGWLTTEFAGSTLDEVPDVCTWERAAGTLGELQIASIGKTSQLLAAGCRDLRVSSLLSMVDPFMELMSCLMEQQQKTPPPALDQEELLRLASQIKETLSELAGLGIPDTLGHLDFNPGNILCSADQCVFLDWAEAYVGPAILTFEYLRAHLVRLRRNEGGLNPDLTHAYQEKWRAILSLKAVAALQRLGPVLAVFAYAAGTDGWRNPAFLREPARVACLRSLTRRMRAEMQRSHERGEVCCK